MNPPSFQINISNAAYLCVELPDMSYVYTLGRLFNINPLGLLVTEEGYPFYPHITLALPYTNLVNITETGVVLELIGGTWTTMGQIKAIHFQFPNLLEDLGNGYFKETSGSGTPTIGNPGEPPFFSDVKIYYRTIQNPQKFYPHAVMKVTISDCNAVLSLARTVIASLTGSSSIFTSPDPTLATLDTQADLLEALIAEVEAGNHIKIPLRDEEAATLYRLLQDETLYVNKMGDGDRGLLVQSGFLVSDPPNPKPIPEQVVIKRMEDYSSPNTAKIYIEPMEQTALTFKVQSTETPDDENSWKLELITGNSKALIIHHRIHGQQLWYRVSASNANGNGLWSTAIGFISNN
jgi:hypothetical protein